MPFSPPVPMIGGEVHHCRVQPRYWPAILDAMQSVGVNVVGVYAHWQLHEIREGAYDFQPLHAFIAQVEGRGLKVLFRPGPFYYAEWRNLGVPDHAAPFHKQHPEFRRKAAHWIHAVVREVLPYIRSGLIVAVQADNEIDPMPHFYGEDLGFADWLRRRYASVERLNHAWGSNYTGFDQPFPTLTPLVQDQRLRDGCQYRYDLATDYARWVVAEFRAAGCTAPILLNTWPGVDAQHWHDLADLSDLYGIDPYPTNECRDDYRYFRERLRLLRAVTDFPYLPEFGCGIWHGMPNREYSPDHYRLIALSALAAGVRGWNWFMLVGRDNWYHSPINERGVPRPELAAAIRETSDWFHTLDGAPPPQTSCAVTWSWHYHQLAQIRKRDVDDPLFAVLHDMGIEYDLLDVDRDLPSASAPRLLLVAGDIAEPRRLWRYVETGGNLVLFQRLIPGVAPPDGTSHPGASNLQVELPGGAAPASFVTNAPVFHYRRPPAAPITATQLPMPSDEDQRRLWELATGRTYHTGYVERRGDGTLMVLGCAPSREAVLAVHDWFGIPIPVLPLTRGVHATRRGDRLIVVNHGEARTARLRIGSRERVVDLPRCSGVILRE